VLESLDAGVVRADLMACPADAEVVAPGRKLADQIRQVLIVRVEEGVARVVAYDGNSADTKRRVPRKTLTEAS
jgi:anti-sigma factor RsiW